MNLTSLGNIVKAVSTMFKGKYQRTVPPDARVGTKVAVNWLVFSAVLIVWLVIGIPWLSIFYANLTSFAPYTDKIIIALIGGATVVFSASEARKTVENVRNVKRPSKNQDESPKSPFND